MKITTTPKVGRGDFTVPPTGDVKPGDEWYQWCCDVWAKQQPADTARQLSQAPKIFRVDKSGEVELKGDLPEYHPLGTGLLLMKWLFIAVLAVLVLAGIFSLFGLFDKVSPGTMMIVTIVIALIAALIASK